jgi:outer membrane protein assembly factor BamD
MSKGNYRAAKKDFEEVERQYPYSPWAIRSQVMAGYASYISTDYDEAIVTLERFVKLHPGNKQVSYAYYLIALCYYEQISDVGRDQKMTERAMRSLQEVIRRFPDTEYARDAKLKFDLTQDHLAGKEMEIGRYYQSRDENLAAINRFKYVVDNFQTTSHVPEALHRLTEIYLELGVKKEAVRYAAVLGHNFPGSDWYKYSYKMIKGLPLPGEVVEQNFWDEMLPEL